MNTIIKNGNYDYILRYYEKDLNLNLKPVSILNFMQDVASMHAEQNGFGATFVTNNNMAWFVLKYRLEILENMNDLKEIHIETESRGTSKLFAFRDFYFRNGETLFAKASSQWAMVDFETKKMAKVQEVLDFLPSYEKRETDLEFEKIPQISNADLKKEFEIRFDDIDINKHVNNPNYLAWALETLDFDFKSSHSMKTLDMYFKKEISYGHNVLSEVQIEGLTTIHSIKNAQTLDELCSIKIEWR